MFFPPTWIEVWGDEVEAIHELDPLTGETGGDLEHFHLYPANQFITPRLKLDNALGGIRAELDERVSEFEKNRRLLEAQRIRMRTEYDLEMLREMGFCSGIENYSRHLSGRNAGDRPWCLIDFFPQDFLLIIDESHATVPQIGAMYKGDRSRKERLVEHGFRLPSALDNRPLRFEEFTEVTGQTVFVSATPAQFELEKSIVVAEQIIRPTGLLDPQMEVRPAKGQVEDLIAEIYGAVEEEERVLVTTLTKRMSEDLTAYLRERKIRVEYLHSDIDAIERIEILRNLRQGDFDVLVGINLLREGLDLPEVALVAILDADKEGFLRSETSLVQTSGRAARHLQGRVILYADRETRSLRQTLDITSRRRERQLQFNEEHDITPRSIERAVQASLHYRGKRDSADPVSVAEAMGDEDVASVIAEIETEMLEAAENLEFERAALLRDQLDALKSGEFRESGSSRPKRRSKKVHRGKSYRPRRR
jgi:excinuclease ABC subunit B